jgi:tetratricopeptide (TPR) repeat protein/predicted Ser/Thr protein kinase
MRARARSGDGSPEPREHNRARAGAGVASSADIHDPRRRVTEHGQARDDQDDSTTRVISESPEPSAPAVLAPDSTTSATASMQGFAREVFSVLLRSRVSSGARTRLGRYLLLRLLGEGGMGVVFLAYDEELDRRVAIKILNVDASGGTMGRSRIRREAQALAKVSHPNIVQIYEVGEEDGQIYLAMELVDGDTLRLWRDAGARSWREVLARWLEVGRGLAAAHKAGLVHRDLKPDNAILGRDGRVRVVDFGLARSGDLPELVEHGPAQAHHDDAALTVAGTLIGTPAYMAPEQHLRMQVDHRADIFAFCVSLYEGLYGERPFDGQGIELATAVVRGQVREAPRRSKVPQRLRRVLLRGLRVDVGERWQDMDTLLAALADDPAQRWRRIAGVGALVLGAAAAGNLLQSEPGDEPPTCAEAGASITAIWNDGRAQTVGAALEATGLPHAADTWTRARALIEAQVGALRTASVAACEDTHLHHRQAPALLASRLACLHERERELAALLTSLASGGAAAVDHAIEASAGLTPPAKCSAEAVLLDRVAPPAEPALAAVVEELRDELARVKATADAGRPGDAVAVIDALVARADASGYLPIQAEAQLRRGLLREASADSKAAEAALTSAWWAALASDHDEVALRAASYLPRVIGAQTERQGEAMVWLENAHAVARRRGLTPKDDLVRLRNLAVLDESAGRYAEASARLLEALTIAEAEYGPASPEASSVHEALGLAQRQTGEYAAARGHTDRALDITRETHGEQHPKLAAILQNKAMILAATGDNDAADAAIHEAIRLTERAYGVDSPRLAFMLNDLAVSTCERGGLAEAERLYRRALDLRIAAHGRKHMLVTTVLHNLGSCLAGEAARRDEARALFEEVLTTREALVGAEHPKVAFPLLGLADLALEGGRLDDAERLYQRALKIRETSLGAEHPRLSFPLAGLAEVALARERPRDAAPLAERALRLHEKATGEAAELAGDRFLVARALGPSLSVRARTLAEQAREGFAAAGPVKSKELAKAEAWLARHPARPRP